MKLIKYGILTFVVFFLCNFCGMATVIAQSELTPDPTVSIMLVPMCVQDISDYHTRIHVGYFADGVDTFKVTFDQTYPNPLSFVSVTEFQTTQSFEVQEVFYIDMDSYDTAYNQVVKITGSTGDVSIVGFNTWDGFPSCDPDAYPIEPDVTRVPPENPDLCPAWAYESVTGDMICLWDLPVAPVVQ